MELGKNRRSLRLNQVNTLDESSADRGQNYTIYPSAIPTQLRVEYWRSLEFIQFTCQEAKRREP